MSWKMKQWLRKMMPLAILALVLYTGYSLMRHGLFRRGLGPAISSTFSHLPVFGSHFRHFSGGGGSSYSAPSYAYRPRYSRHGFSHHRRHHRRHGHHGHRRHRRHHR